MKTNKLTLALATFALTFSAAAFVACGGDDSSQPGPTPRDGGATDSSIQTDGSNPSDSASDSNMVIDTGACVSDAATCNSCYTQQQAQQDPYNACSPATANCIPFDTTRVPANVPRL
jgi:hypothetical protein